MKKCSECGTKMIADRDRIYFTYPARYLFKCPNCGNVEYGLCSDDDAVEENEDNGHNKGSIWIRK